MMKSLFIIIVLVFSQVIYSQSSEDYCEDMVLKMPKVLSVSQKTEFMDRIYKNKRSFGDPLFKEKISQCWVVYSDRADNVLYQDADGFATDKKLDYLDRCFVSDYKGSWLKLVDVKKRNELGWIQASNLILTRNTLLNEKATTRKAMILMSAEELKGSNISSMSELFKKFYYQPTADMKYYANKEARDFKIYYVLKEVGGSVLLAHKDKISKDAIQERENVSGWIPKVNVTFWDHRVCLEKSVSARAVNSYKDKIIPLYRYEDDLRSFLNNQVMDERKVVKTQKLTEELSDAYEMRMPILNNIDEEVKQVASIARLEGDVNNELESNKAQVKRKIIDIQRKMENVDIMFVIDGTKSMKNYYSPVSRSVMNIIDLDKRQNAGNRLRFGLTIYRDYPDGSKAAEVLPLTSDYKKLINKLQTTVCGSADKDLPEALYNGVIQGIKNGGFNPKHNNVLVIIGDAGNHENDVKGHSLLSVVEEVSSIESSLVMFQVNYLETGDGAFDKFNFDAQDIILNAANKSTENFKAKLYYNESTRTFDLGFTGADEDKELFMFGKFTHAELNVPMNGKVLENNIEISLEDYLERASIIRARLERLLNGNQGQFSPALIEMLRKEGMTEEQIEILKSIGDFTTKAYTSMSCYDLGYDAYNPVVFLSQSEKNNLNKILGKLKGGSNSKVRKNFQLALLEQCKKLLGDTNEDNILDKTMNEIWDVILGVPFNGDEDIKNMRLRDLDKTSSMSDITFKSFMDSFLQQAKNFINNTYTDRRFMLAGEWFYWIPLEDFPGN